MENASFPLTRHASRRTAGRSIPAEATQLILAFGRARRRRGADLFMLDREARAEIMGEIGFRTFRQMERKLRAYVVVGDSGSVVTAPSPSEISMKVAVSVFTNVNQTWRLKTQMDKSYNTPAAVLSDFSESIRNATPGDIQGDPTLNGRLVLAQAGPLLMTYAPFESINSEARIVLVGITPGRRQAIDALMEARRLLLAGHGCDNTSKSAKATASFAGAMRTNIAAMLDHVGLHKKCGLASSAELFGQRTGLVHYTSALRYPVFIGGRDYSGATPKMTLHPLLRRQILSTLAHEARVLPDALWIPLGSKVEAALDLLVMEGHLDQSRVLKGLPHASGANGERIAYFLGRKLRADLSAKTEPVRIEAGRRLALETIAALPPMI